MIGYDEKLRNLSLKENLCRLAEILAYSTDWKETGEKLKQLMDEWKQIGHVPRQDADRIWTRFLSARQCFFDRRREHFEKMEMEQLRNLSLKENLCSRAEIIARSNNWKEGTAALSQLMDQWKQIGHVPRQDNDRIWERFQAARQRFFDRRNEYFESMEAEYRRNLDLKENLCVRAECLAGSSNWKETAAEFNQLMTEWKQIGPVPRQDKDRIWNRFQNARQSFFDRRNEYYKEKEIERRRNLSLKEDLCRKADNISYSDRWDETTEMFERLKQEWKQIGPVPKEDYKRIERDFNVSMERFFERRAIYIEQLKESERIKVRNRLHRISGANRSTISLIEKSINEDLNNIKLLKEKTFKSYGREYEEDFIRGINNRIAQLERAIEQKKQLKITIEELNYSMAEEYD